METIKHNKRANTGLIFELLSRQVASNTVSKNDIKVKKSLYLIKKYFRPGTQLFEELQLMNSVLYTEVSKWNTASRVLSEVISQSRKLDQAKLKSEKYALITEINSNFDKKSFFNEYIPNYNTYASLYALIETERKENSIPNVTDKVKLEENVINHLLDNKEIKRINEFAASTDPDLKDIDDVAMFFIIKKFNEKYNQVLTESQKQVLREYIRCTSDKKFDAFAEKHARKIENELYDNMKTLRDKSLLSKVFEAMQKLGDIGKHDKDRKAEMLMTYGQLIEELRKIREQK